MSRFYGKISEKEEFFYPDLELSNLPDVCSIAMARNGKPGIQLLLETASDHVQVRLRGEGFCAEWFSMRKIPVAYNTGDGVSQGGAMVLVDPPEEKPSYVTRKAPFWVYDCLEYCEDGIIPVRDDRAAIYFCLQAKEGLPSGLHTVLLDVWMEEGLYECQLRVHVYDVEIPERTFSVTNWFSEEAICRFHHVESGTKAYREVLRNYIRAMRRLHQDTFFIQLDERCVKSREPYQFSFEHLTEEISCFFEEGMDWMEIGVLLDRGVLPDGSPDMYTDQFKCAMAKEIPIDSEEGYEITVRFVQSLASYLREHGWEQKVLFHVHDEPDIHYRDQETLESRKRQYYLAVSILRKYLPGVRIIEAVDSAEFRGGIDIWVPGTAGYEKRKEEFDRRIALGETVWTYVCCGPEGHWLNRFLDFSLVKGRLLFWGCAKNRMTGFLHWGLNQFPSGMNPYERTSCPNHTGIGTDFPCGDSFLLYPGVDRPNLGMRAEAQRRGAEDVALLQCLRQRDEALFERIVGNLFVRNDMYEEDPEQFQIVYEQLLEALESNS